MEYKLHLRWHPDLITEEEVDRMLADVVDDFDGVGYRGERIKKPVDPKIMIAGPMLVYRIDTLVTIYKTFKKDPRVQNIDLINSGSDALIVQAETAKIQKIKNPKKYEFHEVDGDVTLVECEDIDDFREANAYLDSEGVVSDLNNEE